MEPTDTPQDDGMTDRREQVARALAGAGLVATCVGMALALWTAAELEGQELAMSSEPARLEQGALLSAPLEPGDWATFEVCADARLSLPTSSPGRFLVVHVDRGAEVLRAALDESLAGALRSREDAACLRLGESRGAGLPEGGEYEIRFQGTPPAAWQEARFQARILARRPLGLAPWIPVIVLSFATVLLLIASLTARRFEVAGDAYGGSGLRAALAVALLVAVIVLPGLVPLGGATVALSRAAVIVTAQVSMAWFLAPGRLPQALLGPGGGVRLWTTLAAAPFVAVAVLVTTAVVHRLTPSSGTAPIATLIAWPSGVFAAAVVGLLAPLAEELFFRGLLWNVVASRFGAAVAFLSTTAVFSAVHLPQQWGDWGAFLFVLIAGAAFGSLRWVSRSLIPGAVAHVGHNAILSLPALL